MSKAAMAHLLRLRRYAGGALRSTLVGVLAILVLGAATSGRPPAPGGIDLMAVFARVPGGLMAGNVSPVRELVDPYPTFNSVALDVAHRIAVLSDNNMNGVLVYDLGAGSANGTGITPYLRHIQGPLTHIGSPVGVALDPVKQRIWVADNDIAESVGSFPYDADGDYPAQALAVPVGAYGIGLNQRLQQMAISEEDQSMIMIFRLGAHGGEAPLREIRGPHTHMADPYGLYWDEAHREIAVTNHGDWNQGYWDADYQGGGRYYPPSITVFADDAKGDATPRRVIEGPRTRLNWPLQIALDTARDEIAVANLGDSSVLIFKRTAQGNVAPLRVIAGPHTGLLYPTGVAYDTLHRELWVTNLGHTALVFDSGAEGDARPKRIIRSSPADSPVLGMSHPFNVAYDSKRDQILVRNCNTDPRIGIFERLASGGQAPVRIVHGQRTRLTRTGHGIVYDAARDEIVSSEATAGAIVVFKGGVDGDRAPIRIIQGPRTRLHQPWAVAVDDLHQELLAADYKTGAVLVYPLLAQGDVAPIRIIQGPRTGLGPETGGLAVDPARGLIVVSSYKTGLYIFNRTDNGDVAPRAHIRGPHAGFTRSGQIAVANGLIFAVVGSAGGYRPSYDGGGFAPRKDCTGPPDVTMNGLMTFIGVWSLEDNGDVAPRHFIHGPACEYTSGNGLAVNPRAGEIYLTDALRNGTFVYLVPSFFHS